MAKLAISLFDPIQIHLNSLLVTRFEQVKRSALPACLAVEVVHLRLLERLVELCWLE